MYRIIHNKRIPTSVITLLFLVSISDARLPQAGSDTEPFKTIFVGLEYAYPSFRIDCLLDIQDDDVHFFTSRPIGYLGWHFKSNFYYPISKNYGYGYTANVGIWKTGYWLNWEMPSYSVALDPLESNLTGGYLALGPLFYLHFNRLQIVPFLDVSMGGNTFEIVFEEGSESDDDLYFSLNIGMDANVQIYKDLFLNVGYKANILANSKFSYEVEEGVVLKGEFYKMLKEFYFGVSFQTD